MNAERTPPSAEELRRRRGNAQRAAARRFAVQALYQGQYGEHTVETIAAQFAKEPKFEQADPEYFRRLIRSAIEDTEVLDACYAPFLQDRTVQQLDPICRALMRMASCELLECPEVPTPVILAEAVRLAGRFGDDDLRRFVNGALAEAQTHLRPDPPAH